MCIGNISSETAEAIETKISIAVRGPSGTAIEVSAPPISTIREAQKTSKFSGKKSSILLLSSILQEVQVKAWPVMSVLPTHMTVGNSKTITSAPPLLVNRPECVCSAICSAKIWNIDRYVDSNFSTAVSKY